MLCINTISNHACHVTSDASTGQTMSLLPLQEPHNCRQHFILCVHFLLSALQVAFGSLYRDDVLIKPSRVVAILAAACMLQLVSMPPLSGVMVPGPSLCIPLQQKWNSASVVFKTKCITVPFVRNCWKCLTKSCWLDWRALIPCDVDGSCFYIASWCADTWESSLAGMHSSAEFCPSVASLLSRWYMINNLVDWVKK